MSARCTPGRPTRPAWPPRRAPPKQSCRAPPKQSCASCSPHPWTRGILDAKRRRFQAQQCISARFFLSVARPPHPFGGGPNRARRLSGSERDLVVEVLHRWAALAAAGTGRRAASARPRVFLGRRGLIRATGPAAAAAAVDARELAAGS